MVCPCAPSTPSAQLATLLVWCAVRARFVPLAQSLPQRALEGFSVLRWIFQMRCPACVQWVSFVQILGCPPPCHVYRVHFAPRPGSRRPFLVLLATIVLRRGSRRVSLALLARMPRPRTSQPAWVLLVRRVLLAPRANPAQTRHSVLPALPEIMRPRWDTRRVRHVPRAHRVGPQTCQLPHRVAMAHLRQCRVTRPVRHARQARIVVWLALVWRRPAWRVPIPLLRVPLLAPLVPPAINVLLMGSP